MKRIIAITMVKNEQDIIESFVRHTLSFADELIVCDHQSTDATREILEKLKAEGLPLEIHTEYRAAHVQADVMSKLLREAAEERQADFIVPLDADEFLLPPAGAGLRETFEALSSDRVYGLCWRKYVPHGGAVQTFLLERPLLRERRQPYRAKCFLGGDVARRAHLRLAEGNHYAYAAEDPQCFTFPMTSCPFELAHFFWRSTEQMQSKAIVGWMNIAAQFSEDAVEGGYYRGMATRALHGKTVAWQELLPEAEACDLHGRVRMQTLRYSSAARVDVFQNVVHAALALAQECAVLRAEQQQPCVTSVVPFLGDAAAFRKSLISVCAERFSRHEILIPVVAGAMPQALVDDIHRAAPSALLLTQEAGDVFDMLAMRATGDFVEWVLPGETVLPQKLRAMATSLVLQTDSLAFYISDAPMYPCPAGWPYRSIGATEDQNIQRLTRMRLYQLLLENGVVPMGGMSALLLRREQMDACGWLRDCFFEGTFLFFAAYRTLLMTASKKERFAVGVLHRCYHGGAPVPTLRERMLHQVIWQKYLRVDGDMLTQEQRAKSLHLFRTNGIALLTEAIETSADTTTPLWQQYQAMLRDA